MTDSWFLNRTIVSSKREFFREPEMGFQEGLTGEPWDQISRKGHLPAAETGNRKRSSVQLWAVPKRNTWDRHFVSAGS
jgi:hypothetical protein